MSLFGSAGEALGFGELEQTLGNDAAGVENRLMDLATIGHRDAEHIRTRRLGLIEQRGAEGDVSEVGQIAVRVEVTAKKIADYAEARVIVGRRVLYNVDKIKKYLDAMAV